MKQVNLEEIMIKHLSKHTVDISKTVFRANGTSLSLFDLYRNMMQEACNQTVDLCAENARTRHDYYDKWDENTAYNDHKDEGFERCDGDGMPYGVDVVTINKQSILDTKKQIV